MKTAVHFGAGNIGRGFLGQLYCQSGWQTVFVDVAEELVAALNRRGGYEIHIADERPRVVAVENVRAIDGRDLDAAADALAACDLASAAVGVRAQPHIAQPLAAGLARRARRSGLPLNIIVCENILDAAQALRGLVLEALDDEADREFVRERVGFVGTVVSRMVPVVPDDVRATDPLHVAVEAYATLPVDAEAFVGEPPEIQGMLLVGNIHAHEERKLFCHNLGHAVCAYLGYQEGLSLIADAIAEPSVRLAVLGALTETAKALIARHGFEPDEYAAHVADLIRRFGNRALGDTVERVARDPIRKLGRCDRLVGAALLCLDHDIYPTYVLEGISAALRYDHPDDAEAVCLQQMLAREGIDAVVQSICGLGPDEPLHTLIREVVLP